MGPGGTSWTQEEDQLPRQEVSAGTPLDVIAAAADRPTNAAILIQRLTSLCRDLTQES
jgi:hypothetical protein